MILNRTSFTLTDWEKISRRALRAVISAAAVVCVLASCNKQSLENTYSNQETKIDTYAESVEFIECELTANYETGSYTMERVDTIIPRITRNETVVRLTMVEGTGDQLSSKGKVVFHYAGFVFSSGPTSVQMAYLPYTDNNGDSDYTWLFSTPYQSINVSGNITTGATISGSGSVSGLTFFGTNHYLTSQFTGWGIEAEDYDAMEISLNDKTVLEGLRLGLEGVRAGEVCDVVFSGKYGIGKRPIWNVPSNSSLLYRVWVEEISN